ncbi:hypothetical protein SDC9_212947 [bioreactor metagenome]|uniref:Uncharacterized protein n=1 Tax=bioreactor metagenome TaxID=1076179 RepID=A0A645JNC8_9ZZZZ
MGTLHHITTERQGAQGIVYHIMDSVQLIVGAPEGSRRLIIAVDQIRLYLIFRGSYGQVGNLHITKGMMVKLVTE